MTLKTHMTVAQRFEHIKLCFSYTKHLNIKRKEF